MRPIKQQQGLKGRAPYKSLSCSPSKPLSQTSDIDFSIDLGLQRLMLDNVSVLNFNPTKLTIKNSKSFVKSVVKVQNSLLETSSVARNFDSYFGQEKKEKTRREIEQNEANKRKGRGKTKSFTIEEKKRTVISIYMTQKVTKKNMTQAGLSAGVKPSTAAKWIKEYLHPNPEARKPRRSYAKSPLSADHIEYLKMLSVQNEELSGRHTALGLLADSLKRNFKVNNSRNRLENNLVAHCIETSADHKNREAEYASCNDD